jgi:hypothetical protein
LFHQVSHAESVRVVGDDWKSKIKGGGTVAAQDAVCTRIFAARGNLLLGPIAGKSMTRHKNRRHDYDRLLRNWMFNIVWTNASPQIVNPLSRRISTSAMPDKLLAAPPTNA